MDAAIRAQDPKSIKDYASAYSTFAKQADLETMINDSKTDDITTVAELYQYMEDNGFVFKYHDGTSKDEVDQAINDIQEANRRLILESTGLETLLEEMIRKKMNEIIEFSELGSFIDVPVKNYSSGMHSKLALEVKQNHLMSYLL